MAVTDRTAPDPVERTRALREQPQHFDFFHAVRTLECAYRGKPRVGESVRAADDPVRLGQEPSMAFAPSTLASFAAPGEARPARLEVLFFGCFGPNGPLPLHLTEYARERLRSYDDPTFARFVDIFHHRMLSLFYRAWAQAQPTANFDREESDRFATYVGALFGSGLQALRRRDAMPDHAKLHFGGRLASQTRNAEGLEAIIADFFDLPVRIETFVGQWLAIPKQDRWRLGESPTNGTLGQTALLGSHVWECQQQFRIHFGPLRLNDYLRLLPGSKTLERLVAVVRNYVGDELGWDVRPILKKEDVPFFKLDGKSRLGWTTWLNGQSPEKDAGDTLLDPLAAHA